MSTGRAPPPSSVPTLTEVVSWPEGPGPEPVESIRAVEATASAASPFAAAPPTAPILSPRSISPSTPPTPVAVESDADVATRLLLQIRQQLELAIDVRLREALTPVLARAADTIVRDARREMAAALRDIVERAVEAELTQRRGR